ncbi:4-hydroxyproline epimerase [Labilibaculum manganireducens]|uniref:4-hydroxyproline epimerase n=1 Tax=Labilibaculum manganireducens TaxID=1940525 RepID=UPI0029F5AB81|nr:4-hydroxyproline epimerase [Labilibaculum manganireducens]
MAKKTFFCIDGHTCGNPVRVVAGGVPQLQGKTISEKREHFLREYDWIRHGLMFEPRGHEQMSGSFIFPPENPQNDAGILFIETSGCLPMCGHGTIGTVTIAIEEGLVLPKTPGKLMLETPAGLVAAHYVQNDKGKVTSVKIINVPSFLYKTDLKVDSPNLGELTVDVAYGGNFYAIVDEQANFSGLHHFTADELISYSGAIRTALNEKYSFVHPENEKISGLSHVLWTGNTISPEADARNAVFYGERAIDRCPCGTGTSARMAQWFSKGKLELGSKFLHESIIGSQFVGTVEEHLKIGEYDAIVPAIEGWAMVTGYNTIIIDDEDPYAHGFRVGGKL